MPWKIVCFKYQSNRFAAVKCVVVGLCINWDSLLTAKEMSGWVRDKYCRAPIILLYSLLSTEDVPLRSLSTVVVDNGVITALAPCIFSFINKSLMYLC